MKSVAYAIAIFLLIGLTVADKLLIALGVDVDILTLTLVAMVITHLAIYRSTLAIAIVAVIALLLYAPASTLHRLDLNEDVLLATLLAVLLTPEIYNRFLK